MSQNTSISIVIPNYNGKNLLEQNLPYLYRALTTSKILDFEIIVTDDASSDDSIVFLENKYPNVIVVKNTINKGFGGNCNQGIKAATKNLVFLLNSDVTLTDGYFIHLLPYFQNPNCFGVMGSIWNQDFTKLQDAAKYPALYFGKIKGSVNYTSSSPNTTYYSFFLSGANALIDRKKLNLLKGFDELFNPYYFEDLDLGLRAWRNQYICYYEPKAKCVHPISTTIKKEPSPKVTFTIERNKIYIHAIHLPYIQKQCYFLYTYTKAILQAAIANKTLLQALKTYRKNKVFVNNSRKNTASNTSLIKIKNRILNNINQKSITTF